MRGPYDAGELHAIDQHCRAVMEAWRRETAPPVHEDMVQPAGATHAPAAVVEIVAFVPGPSGIADSGLRVRRLGSGAAGEQWDVAVWSYDAASATPAEVGRVPLPSATPWRVGSIVRVRVEVYADGQPRWCAVDAVEARC